MRKWALLLLLTLCAAAQPPQAKHIANYNIVARLAPAEKAVSGRETLTWLNDSGDAVSELRFHLYMNAFKNSRSTFMKESGGRLRGDRAKQDEWGWIDVKRMQIAGGADLTKAIQFIHPDDENAEDRTVIRVPLPAPVPPGGSIQLEIDFYTKFPKVFARTGYFGNFYLGGQWFPKIGVYERMGMRYATAGGQWNCHQFHANTEFYANFGKYAVDLTVPSEYVVGATGVLKKQAANNDGTTTYSFYQENVHDFAWTAQPGYIKHERMFIADNDVSPIEVSEITRRLGITHEEARLTDVKMILLLQPEHARQAEKHFRAVAAGIKYFGLWYGRYPHQTITVVDPPRGGGGAAGMEYPTLITAGTGWLVGANEGRPEHVTVHEFGHQFWQGLVANNEFEEAWMDEGFNTYSTGKVMDQAFGARDLSMNVLGIPLTWWMSTPSIRSGSMDRMGYLGMAEADNLARNAWQYRNSSSYGINSYPRTAVVLTALENYLGEDAMGRVMRGYHQRWRYGHPSAEDFIKAAQEISGKDLKWFFDQYFYGSNVVDYAIDEISSRLVTTGVGVFGETDSKRTVTSADAEKMDKDQKLYDSKVTVKREGEATFPVEIVVRFENGDTERRQWDGQYRWVRYEFRKASKIAWAAVDPDHRVVLDVNWSNNSRTMEARPRTPVKWVSTLLFWAEQAMAMVTAFA